MSFREKSAWAMGAVMLAAGLWYLAHAGGSPLAAFIPFTILVIVLSIAVQIVLAILSRREAQQPADERERVAIAKAGHWSGIVLAVGAVGGALHYMAHGNGDLLFHTVIGALIVSQIAEYAFQIALFRRGY